MKEQSRADVRKDQRGAAMIVVMCILAVLMALSLAILLSASVVMANAQKALLREQSRICAVGFSEGLEAELLTDYADPTFQNENEGLRKWLRDNIGGGAWGYYNETISGRDNKASATKAFQASGDNIGADGAYGEIKVDMYWEWEPSNATQDEDGYNLKYDGCVLNIIVTSAYKGQTYKIKSKYTLSCKRESEAAQNPDAPDESADAPVSWKWQRTWRE